MPRARASGGLTLLVLICMAELIFFVLMMCAYEAPNAMISDTIFTDPAYKVALSVMLMMRLVIVFLFLLSNRGAGDAWMGAGMLGVALAAGGWCLLVEVHEEKGHYSGVGVFCAGSLLYSLALCAAARASHPHLADMRELMVRTLLLCTAVLVVVFSCMFWSGERQAFLVEHFAYITFLLFYTVFFCLHWPRDGWLARGMQEEVSLPQCTPLLPM